MILRGILEAYENCGRLEKTATQCQAENSNRNQDIFKLFVIFLRATREHECRNGGDSRRAADSALSLWLQVY
jgi:hypothetical protein